jgi:hypothetical protein
VTPSNPYPHRARNIVILREPATLLVYFFVILGLQIQILICYIDFILLCCFDMLHCHIALICYIAFNMSQCFNMPHCFDMIHCFWYAALHWYATLPRCFDMLHYFCYDALLWYAILPHCFDMLHIATLLLLSCLLIYMNAYYITRWSKWAKWDDYGNMDRHYCIIKISASNNM